MLLAAAALLASGCGSPALQVALPPVHAGLDYQLGGPYPPPPDAQIVVRDHAAAPAPGRYNICYVNAFQVQPGAEREWAPDLLLRDDDGDMIIDETWNEAVLDIRTADKRSRIAARVNGWIDDCAAQGYQAVEPDNYDSYTRSGDRISDADAQAHIRLLAAHAHSAGLAIGQKNTPELARDRAANGLDFAITEECGQFDECDEYTAAFGDHVLVIEYTPDGLAAACAGWGDRLSIVQRDIEVAPAGEPGHVRRTC